ncbi:lipopolysaccharide biosynthesis protein [Nocardioides sp. CFH 31398]|uniref:lipopolysaccharide biosynthesis protein n=1 Tax=Nocardioides sp. CFH 31398 TaxID=2919579 RepID=UPI001F060BA2|nr:oligosaccharide flippase family protein [Nocardioides sp. CFH 31398]MCH1868325.1 oligosaccharide flippase family protein [Nocardioides sp. CFH 31398]
MNAGGGLRRLLRGGAGVAVAMAVLNLTTYGFTILAARALGPAEYSAVAALMGLLLVINVVSLGLQATGARQVAAAPEAREAIEARILRAGRRSGLALALVCLALAPVVTIVLDLTSPLAAVFVALAAAPLSMMGAQAGVFQGEEDWGPLSAIYVAAGTGRLVLGGLGLLLLGDATGAMAGVAVGAVVPVLVGARVLRRRRTAPAPPSSTRVVLREVGHNSHALLAFFALSNVDVVLARVVLDAENAGLYAGGLILTKAVLFLPQFVVVVAFPRMASGADRTRATRLSLLATAVIGAVATAGAALLSGLAVVFVGGAAYREIEPLVWVFAAVGTLLAMIQILVYQVVADQHRRAVLVLWAGMAALLAAAPVATTEPRLLAAVAAVDVLVLVGLLVATRTRRDEAAAPVPGVRDLTENAG